MSKHITLVQSTLFNASIDKIWEKLEELQTLQYIAYPYATFTTIDSSSELVWKVGETFYFKFKLFGLIPLGTHTIHIVQFDRSTAQIYSKETNIHVPIWNHRIRLEYVDETATRYTDEVEIDAGWKTIFIYLWATVFYKHRQRKWKKLLR